MRDAKIEPLVKREGMATRAGISEFDGGHQLASACRFRRMRQRSKGNYAHLIALFVANNRSAIARIRVSQIRSGGASVVAISTLKLNVWPLWAAANPLHMNGVIKFDASQIPAKVGTIPPESREFWVTTLQAIDS